MLRSHYVNELSEAMDGQEVTLAGWVHEVRETAKITFLLLRDRTGIVQITCKQGEADEALIKKMSIPKESVVKIVGTVKKSSEAKKGFEIAPKSIENLNPISRMIPFEVTGKVPVDLDVRLNYRYVDLRRSETKAIFSIQHTILGFFRNYLSKLGFQEIRTPCIISEASEGGSEVFSISYYDRTAYLAQSPQLYKQLAIIGGLDKVMMIVPVFRAEKSNTTSHLSELTQMDIEMGFAYADDVIDILKKTVVGTIKEIIKRNKDDLEVLNAELNVPKVKIVTYSNAIKILKKRGYDIEFGHDFSREHEEAMQKEFGDAVVVKDFPAELRAFYSMPKETDPRLTNSFDFLYKGLEISSGAQRIHNPELLIKSLEKRGLNPKNFESYIDAFRCGAPPHSGWSIGLERLTMKITGAKNVKECSMFPRDVSRLTP